MTALRKAAIDAAPEPANDDVMELAGVLDSDTKLPERLQEVVDGVADDERRLGLRLFFGTSAAAIEMLSDLDFAAYDDAHLGLWDMIQPVIEETGDAAREYLATLRAQFPIDDAESGGLLDAAFANAFALDGASIAASDDPMLALVQPVAAQISRDIDRFEAATRTPIGLDSKWPFLTRLSEVRGTLRSTIAELVFAAASQLGDVRRGDVIPRYDEVVLAAVALRRQTTVLRRRVDLYHGWLTRAQASVGVDALRGWLMQVQEAVELFTSSTASGGLRPADRSRFVEHRVALRALLSRTNPSLADARRIVTDLAALLAGMAMINRRDVLVRHDRDAVEMAEAQVRALLEDAPVAREQGGGGTAMNTAVATSDQLFGRDAALDDAVAVLRRQVWSEVSRDDLCAGARLLQRHLQGLHAGL